MQEGNSFRTESIHRERAPARPCAIAKTLSRRDKQCPREKDRAFAFLNSGKLYINFKGGFASVIYNLKSHFINLQGQSFFLTFSWSLLTRCEPWLASSNVNLAGILRLARIP